MSNELQKVPISQIRENPVALRTVNRQSEDYLGLVASIQQKGFISSISVRQKTDPESGEIYFELVDGLHRLSAARDAGIEEINVVVVDLDDSEVLEAQILANIHKVETKPAEYSKQLQRILSRNPLMTEAELASRLGKSTQWIVQRLGLAKIDNEEIIALIDDGKIKLGNAYALAKLPPEEQPNWIQDALTLSPEEFITKVNARIKEIKEERRKGKKEGPVEFTPTPHMQKMAAIKDALSDVNSVVKPLVIDSKITDPAEAATMMLKWVLHLDPKSVEEQKTHHEDQIKKREEAKKRRNAERAVRRQEQMKLKDKEAAEAAEAAAEVLNDEQIEQIRKDEAKKLEEKNKEKVEAT